VAGYVQEGPDGKEVKHIVVNGAFNPGNSGGPLLQRQDSKVIGVVVAKFHLYPPFVEKIIEGLNNEKYGMMHGVNDANGKPLMGPDGQPLQVSEAQMVGAVLEQFYKTTQVMIGEAISVAELRTFMKEKKSEVE